MLFLLSLFLGLINGQTYIAVTRRLPYTSAANECQRLYGTHLAIVSNLGENNEIQSLLLSRGISYALIFKDFNQGGSNWGSGEPSTSGVRGLQECVAIRSNGQWDSAYCGDSNYFVCQRIARIYQTPNFYIVRPARTFIFAKDFCEKAYGTHLAIVSSSSQNTEIRSEMSRRGISYALIFNDLNQVGNNWGPNEPSPTGSRGTQDCIAIRSNGEWDSAYCFDANAFVCSKQPSAPVIPFNQVYKISYQRNGATYYADCAGDRRVQVYDEYHGRANQRIRINRIDNTPFYDIRCENDLGRCWDMNYNGDVFQYHECHRRENQQFAIYRSWKGTFIFQLRKRDNFINRPLNLPCSNPHRCQFRVGDWNAYSALTIEVV